MNMDRFKYRAFIKSLNELIYLRWFCIESDGTVSLMTHDGRLMNLKLDDVILEQCTGLKDKNGKLIYEADQVKDRYGSVYNVIWNPIRCQFRATKGCSWYLTDSIEIQPGQEIIGNIHEKAKESEAKNA